ncbi:hypothetical protein TRV_02414 [Trichophyton verrucosum HKI 0517]|uniref:CCD97-like C-terminal domain-containing protein n=1 Tax=Trichophyton verrucosum (strain HKI 0517) TaxID=663202 RepID=D4D5P1_TRIVH|nr:uncharacterized protein TRV_02414 [Trichophyton verrucosum HKI 0517]EFE42812.1 hypothetical protein TRV_02414 [Trichophyton verrucosum HKI 0517]
MPLFPMTSGKGRDISQDQKYIPTSRPQPKNPPASIQIKNRRKRYLELHPEYFSPALELADPLLYDRLIRRFQTASEREAEGRLKGHSGTLEADLERAEAKMEALANPDPDSLLTYSRGPNGEILAEDADETPSSKAEGQERWRYEMEMRFVKGADDQFEYGVVDECEEYDDLSEEQERYFDEEEPEWIVDDEGGEGGGGGDRELKGETGVQDL